MALHETEDSLLPSLRFLHHQLHHRRHVLSACPLLVHYYCTVDLLALTSSYRLVYSRMVVVPGTVGSNNMSYVGTTSANLPHLTSTNININRGGGSDYLQ